MIKRQYTLYHALKVMRSTLDLDGVPIDQPEYRSSTRKGDGHWCDRSLEVALEQAETGDLETLAKVDEVARLLKVSGSADSEVEESTLTYDVIGEVVDVGRFLDGEPENMLTFAPQPAERVVQIVVDIGASSDIPDKSIRERGSAIFRAIRALELRGYSVGLTVALRSKADSPLMLQTEIVLKQPGEHLSPAVAAFWICSSAALRRCWFAMMEREPQKIRKDFGFHFGGGYGYPRDIGPEDFLASCILVPKINQKNLDLNWFGTIAQRLKERGIRID
jgi:hypothetical protein